VTPVGVLWFIEVGEDDVVSKELDRIIQHVGYVKYKGTFYLLPILLIYANW